ncbi:AbiV family abortive infection protein [Peribacillus frigoritolerans]|uniref:AbiV family abortive infection protein n=1 Tax=Peribacillus frigoritolerans TaxID=450367 RepID=UPI002E1DE0F0|nr:AbiV family abortive infection protein [Peribacillus frigoritolerans]
MSLNNFKELQMAYNKTFYNASELLEESQLLFDNRKFARAYLMAHISIEEFARCIMLSSAAMKFKIRALDVKKLIKRQTNHKSKIELAYSLVNKMKGYSSPLDEEDRLDILLGFFDSPRKNIINEEEVQKLNKLKNASFYVDQYNNSTKSPNEVISKEQAQELITSAMLLKEFIGFTKWHEDENLIDLVKQMDNELLLKWKENHFPDKNKA